MCTADPPSVGASPHHPCDALTRKNRTTDLRGLMGVSRGQSAPAGWPLPICPWGSLSPSVPNSTLQQLPVAAQAGVVGCQGGWMAGTRGRGAVHPGILGSPTLALGGHQAVPAAGPRCRVWSQVHLPSCGSQRNTQRPNRGQERTETQLRTA